MFNPIYSTISYSFSPMEPGPLASAENRSKFLGRTISIAAVCLLTCSVTFIALASLSGGGVFITAKGTAIAAVFICGYASLGALFTVALEKSGLFLTPYEKAAASLNQTLAALDAVSKIRFD